MAGYEISGYLIAEEGPLLGLTIALEEGKEWLLGRDEAHAFQVLEDPAVSRRHVIIHREDDHFILENISSSNPAAINGHPIAEPKDLHEGDIIQIGATFFRFTMIKPDDPINEEPNNKEPMSLKDLEEEVSLLSLADTHAARWIIKIISGPNTGAEFSMQPGHTYILGKDPTICDIFFQDLSVSKQHCKITINEDDTVIIEDLNSRNGVIVNGNVIEKEQTVHSQDLINLGTTSFLIIDKEQTRETIYSPIPSFSHLGKEEIKEEEKEQIAAIKKNWKELFIPTKHIILGSAFVIFLALGLFSVLSLFKTTSVVVNYNDQKQEIEFVLKKFPAVEFNYTNNSGNLFLLGHVLTDIEHQEMIYLLKSLPFVATIDDNVIIDELVWEEMNALLFKNPDWRSVLIIAPEPGKFILKGYLKTSDQIAELIDYVNNNFPYLDKLENRVVVENSLEIEIQSLLISKGFVNVTFNLASGELTLAGRVGADSESDFKNMIAQFKQINGIKDIKNYVVYIGKSSARINVSSQYQVAGTSKYGDANQFVLINGKILSMGDLLDGMLITQITATSVLLEKEGLKYIIDYNL
ncbi:MAG: type III secretion system inner membrane ring subunit SctD [Chlamydiales bacterium]|nr:type III secretion system inner membrane ring subunit SctD [Chlamydiales bacterium]